MPAFIFRKILLRFYSGDAYFLQKVDRIETMGYFRRSV